jgi:hypothetical protein
MLPSHPWGYVVILILCRIPDVTIVTGFTIGMKTPQSAQPYVPGWRAATFDQMM